MIAWVHVCVLNRWESAAEKGDPPSWYWPAVRGISEMVLPRDEHRFQPGCRLSGWLQGQIVLWFAGFIDGDLAWHEGVCEALIRQDCGPGGLMMDGSTVTDGDLSLEPAQNAHLSFKTMQTVRKVKDFLSECGFVLYTVARMEHSGTTEAQNQHRDSLMFQNSSLSCWQVRHVSRSLGVISDSGFTKEIRRLCIIAD